MNSDVQKVIRQLVRQYREGVMSYHDVMWRLKLAHLNEDRIHQILTNEV